MAKRTPATGEPKFPYTTEPKALRRLLVEIPKRPKPPKLTMEVLKSWGVSKNNNARTAVNVLKKLGLIGSAGEPTDYYIQYMQTGTGPGVLGMRIKDVYKSLFDNVHAPQDEPAEELRKLFNIHSGGGEDAMRLQVQTFKALAEHANFGAAGATGSSQIRNASSPPDTDAGGGGASLPPIRVDLHIHLPENKTSREYETIIQDIAKYIYGRDIQKS